ncbi:MAG: sugar phosphate nucleotidyltransferase [Candidatus Dojkabacteria bacterium]|nr:sugar phosphate nucleotidyltransferase [Candidatus Dojkabacteria bacterium]
MNSKISLFVLAAGMGSRYGGLKQMEGFGPSGETIIDYSIYDAVRAGFDKFVFVIRPDMQEAFEEIFMNKYKGRIDISYVFQSLDMIPDWYKINSERVKPWGTGQALLVAKDLIKEPSYVISSDDFYGKETFEIVAKFLREECSPELYSIPVYKLKNVLSEYGTVKRGICFTNNGYLDHIEETFEVGRGESGEIKGRKQSGEPVLFEENTPAAMSSYGIHPSIFPNLEERFDRFLKNLKDDLTEEYLLPEILSDMVEDEDIKIKILETNSDWFGVTYKEDGPIVREKLKELVNRGVYPKRLEL